MKDRTDNYTRDMLSRRPGRPAKPDALTPAQRAKRYRDKKREAEANQDPIATLAETLQQLPPRDLGRLKRLLF